MLASIASKVKMYKLKWIVISNFLWLSVSLVIVLFIVLTIILDLLVFLTSEYPTLLTFNFYIVIIHKSVLSLSMNLYSVSADQHDQRCSRSTVLFNYSILQNTGDLILEYCHKDLSWPKYCKITRKVQSTWLFYECNSSE